MKLELSKMALSDSFIKDSFIKNINLDNGYIVIEYGSGDEIRLNVEDLHD